MVTAVMKLKDPLPLGRKYMTNLDGIDFFLVFQLRSHTRLQDLMKLRFLMSHHGKNIINLGSILKSRDITLPTKVWLVQAMVFPVVMYGCESWTIKKAEH